MSTQPDTPRGVLFSESTLCKCYNFGPRTATTNNYYRLYCAGNIAGPHLFLATEVPRYPTAIKGLAGAYGAAMGLQAIYTALCYFNNKTKMKNGMLGEADFKEAALEGFEDLTDKQNKHFRYRV